MITLIKQWNSYVPAEFVDWIQNKPDHPVYKLFGFEDDEKMALNIVSKWLDNLAGCKITVQYKIYRQRQ